MSRPSVPNKLPVLAGALVAGVLIFACAAAGPAGGATAGSGEPLVLGTFDSRAVAIAYVRSDGFRAYMADLHRQLDAAKAAGDAARVAELEAFGPQLQEQLHRQGFSTASVADILEHVADRLPDLAREAGVDVIVSRWDLVYLDPGAHPVDVTEALVLAFDPDEATLTSTREIVRQPPVPEDELELHH